MEPGRPHQGFSRPIVEARPFNVVDHGSTALGALESGYCLVIGCPVGGGEGREAPKSCVAWKGSAVGRFENIHMGMERCKSSSSR